MAKSLREEMPAVTAFIDDLRQAFGAAQINAAIKAGIDGQPTFYASENGREIGTKRPRNPEKEVCPERIELPAKEKAKGRA